MGAVFLTDDDRAKIERIAGAMFVQQRALSQVPKMASAVVLDGEVISFNGHDASPDSLFRIASMTKSFSAAATLLIRDEGLVRLDEPVGTYVPEYARLVGPTADAPAITLRQLLTMSSGLATDDPWGDRHLDITDSEFDAVVQNGPTFGRDPGTGFEYSNLGYGIIGRVIHRVTGDRPQAFITRRILQPLGMHHTVWEASQAPDGTDVIIGTRSDFVTPETAPLDGGLATMGGLWSTVADLAKWIAFFTDAFPPRDDGDLFPLRRASRREMQCMHTFHEPLAQQASDGTEITNNGGYGMGLLLQHDEHLGEIVGHSGGLPGYGSNMRWFKGSGFGVIALGNATYAPMATATRRVLQALSAAKVVRKPVREVPERLRTAGDRLFALLSNWTPEAATDLFADNVGPDQAFAERRTEAVEFLAKHQSLRSMRIEATSNSAGHLVVASPTTELSIPFMLAVAPGPDGAPLVQSYDLPSDF